MPLSEETQKVFSGLQGLVVSLKETEETIMQTSSVLLADKGVQAVQRIQISNNLVQASANVRNCITQIENSLVQMKNL